MPEIKVNLTQDQIDTLYSLLNEQESNILMTAARSMAEGDTLESKRLLDNVEHYSQIRAELATAWQGVQS